MQNQTVQDFLDARNSYQATGHCSHERKFRKVAKVGTVLITQCGVCSKIFDKELGS